MNGAAPLAVVDNVNTASPVLYHVHADHLDRPVMMTSSAKTAVWEAQYRPFGEVSAVSGTATLNLRFPGQWYQLEAGLATNWHRHDDATLGRTLQPDPLGFVDGPSVYAYAKSSPQMLVDPDGRVVPLVLTGIAAAVGILTPETANAPGPDDSIAPSSPLSPYINVVDTAAGLCGIRFGALGKEVKLSSDFRIAPGGNRTGNKYGELPHYHRRGPENPETGKTVDGQGIGRHRPWESKSTDKSFWDRF